MAAKVVPAQLAFLAIYCPSLASSDETFRDQLLFYYSKAAKSRKDANGDAPEADDAARNDEHIRLRQIGLAQGMVDFARSFSNGEPVDHVDTEKSRIVLHELENGWWVLASIDLTRLPAHSTSSKPTDSGSPSASPELEYSAREVAPPRLLVTQILRAHNVFQLHHGPSLADLYKRLPRQRFCAILDKFWARFAGDWDVLMHGSPATDVYNGVKLAAGGELGMGVGEEEWGSGERDVFEDFATRTDGLVDMVISRFGEPSKDLQKSDPKATTNLRKSIATQIPEPWMGAGMDPEAGDGVIFSGMGAISRCSLRDLTNWMQWIYTYGEHAYGVKENPTSGRQRRRRPPRAARKAERSDKHQRAVSQDSGRRAPARTASSLPPGIPRPIVTAVEQSLDQASEAAQTTRREDDAETDQQAPDKDKDTWMKYLTLGYGSNWNGKKSRSQHQRSQSTHARPHGDSEKRNKTEVQPNTPPSREMKDNRISEHIKRENGGHFLIGLQSNLDEDTVGGEAASDAPAGSGDWESRMLIRTVHVEVKHDKKDFDRRASEATVIPGKWEFQKLRVIVYVHRPFITTLLFAPRTDALSYPAFYRHLHSYLAPLHKPLSLSTAPARVAARIAASSYPYTAAASNSNQPIYDLVYDPLRMTIHSSIPNIPQPGTFSAEGLSPARLRGGGSSPWTRIEALNVHAQILATLAGTRRSPHEIERTAKTSRGWWLVWMRLPPSEDTSTDDGLPPASSTQVSPEASPWLAPASDETVASMVDRSPSSAGVSGNEITGEDHPASSTDAVRDVPLPSKSSSTPLRSISSPVASPSPPASVSSASSPSSDSTDASTIKRPSVIHEESGPVLPTATLREAILIRRSRDAPGGSGHRRGVSGAGDGGSGSGSLWPWGFGGSSASSGNGRGGDGAGGEINDAAAGTTGWGARGLVEGVGVDARKYVEGLLSLNR
ncbi:uncharacterized protein J3D65DRAFT_613131 [Phyllosticta citribraziliensis]|uniref:CCZ1/INTU/HSP4 first Longin domain-containing protein n=1 Tax=Phyllosticta citribraziliensis TaxID=989973 RepID=A0ABR1M7J4_9PEZI